MRKTPVVLGVLSMVFGGIQVFISAITMVAQPFTKQLLGASEFPQREGEPNVGELIKRAGSVADELNLYTYFTGIMLALSTALILVGYMLYTRRAQSRPAALAWAIAALAYLPVQAILYLKVVAPRIVEVTKLVLQGIDPRAQGMAMMVASLLLYAPFPVVLLALMGRKSAKNDLITVP